MDHVVVTAKELLQHDLYHVDKSDDYSDSTSEYSAGGTSNGSNNPDGKDSDDEASELEPKPMTSSHQKPAKALKKRATKKAKSRAVEASEDTKVIETKAEVHLNP